MRHKIGLPIYTRFDISFVQCPEVIGEDICGCESITVSGYFEHPDDAMTPETISCRYGHEIDFNKLSALDQTKILEKAQDHLGDSIASYCDAVQTFGEDR